MHLCETCQPQLLNYVYDLLEDDERRPIEAHLETCAHCREALARARAQQDVLKAATRASFPDVRFTPPVVRSFASATEASASPRPVRQRPWRRWAAAACIALILGGGAAFGVYGWHTHRSRIDAAETKLAEARSALADSEQNLTQQTERSRADIERIRDNLRKLMDEWKDADTQVRRNIGDKNVEVIVTGPKNLRAGAVTEYEVELKRPRREAGKDMPVRVGVVDPESKETLYVKEVNGDKFKFDVPANLDLKPGVEP